MHSDFSFLGENISFLELFRDWPTVLYSSYFTMYDFGRQEKIKIL